MPWKVTDKMNEKEKFINEKNGSQVEKQILHRRKRIFADKKDTEPITIKDDFSAGRHENMTKALKTYSPLIGSPWKASEYFTSEGCITFRLRNTNEKVQVKKLGLFVLVVQKCTN